MASELTYSINVAFSKDEDTLDVNWDDVQDVSAAKSELRLVDCTTTLAQITYPAITNPQMLVYKNIGTATVTLYGGNTTNPVAIVGAGKLGLLTVDSTCDIRQKTASGTSQLKVGLVAT